MISNMRLLLAVCVLFASYVEPAELPGIDAAARILFSGYVVYSTVLFVFSALNAPTLDSKLIHWVDILWYALFIGFTGGTSSIFYLFFFFAIFTASVRWGFEEGARTTIASVTLFAASGILVEAESDFSRLLLRCAFMLALGYMSAHWGETKLEEKRRVALLRDVTRLLNPRFGVDHTINSLLEKTKEFFRASNCMLIMHERGSTSYSLRTSREDDATHPLDTEQISSNAVAPLIAFSPHCIVLYSQSAWPATAFWRRSLTYDKKMEKWSEHDARQGESAAELLDAHSFISAPVSLRTSKGRIYVASRDRAFRRSDALFLSHIVAHVFPFIENVEVLDRMASEAAIQERQRISWDLHDTAIQPYIGLQLGLAAVRQKAAPDNPLTDEIDKLVAMTTQVIGDLRRFAGTFKQDLKKSETALLTGLRQKANQTKEFYGVDIAVSLEDGLGVSDRLTIEILQIVSEGLSNICKHTNAQHGHIRIRITNERLTIQIENDGADNPPTAFIPHSIAERAGALGGTIHVKQETSGSTAVHIEIPV